MYSPTAPSSPSFTLAALAAARRAAAPAGHWKLAHGRAVSLHPRSDGAIAVARGRAWVTLGGGPDHVLLPGERLAVAAGQHVVLEAWTPPADKGCALAFEWRPAAAAAPSAAGQRAARACAQWDCAVRQPLRELGRALAEGGRAVATAGAAVAVASGRLARGLARWAYGRATEPRWERAA